MLREIKDTQQKTGEPQKRWFTSLDMDVFVWLGPQQNILSYHLAYDKQGSERALVWDHKNGFTHSMVDAGANAGKYPRSPIMTGSEPLQSGALVEKLMQNQGDLDACISEFIIAGVLQNFASS